MFDTHAHTHNSPDSNQKVSELCEKAIEKGFSGITITDHADMESAFERDTFTKICNSIKEASEANEKYKGKLKVLKGIELAGFSFDKSLIESYLAAHDYDIVIGSIHKVSCDNPYYSGINFENYDDEHLFRFSRTYFQDIKEMVNEMDFDVLAHLTCPLRYIVGKYKRKVDMSAFAKEIEYILNVIINRKIALELNISGIESFYGEYMPTLDIVKKYYDLGGRLVTIGSDAHSSDRVGVGFKKAKADLKKIGFTHYCYYEKRKPVLVEL